MPKSNTPKFDFNPNDWIPGHSIDCVVFGFDHDQIRILLLHWANADTWSLPGGFIRRDEHMDAAAKRVMNERTGLQDLFLSQFYTFGDFERRNWDPSSPHIKGILEWPIDVRTWFDQRFITTGYFGFAEMNKSNPQPDHLSDRCEWVAIDELPTLIFDHEDIIKQAMSHVRTQLNYLPFGKSLLAEQFTMSDLQKLYESIIQRPLDRGNFQRRMLKLGIFKRHEKQLNGGAHKAPYLYSFDQNKYEELIEKGIGFI